MKRRVGAMMLAAAVGGCMTSNHRPEAVSTPTVRASGQYLPNVNVPGVEGPYGTPVPMAATYTMTPPKTAYQANKMMQQSVPLEMMGMDPNVMQAAHQLGAAQGGMGMPPMGMMPPGGGMMPPGGGMMPPGMMPPGGGMMPPGMMPPGGGMMPPGMMPPGGMTPQNMPMPNFGNANQYNAPSMVPPSSMPFMMNGGAFPGGRPPGAVAAIGAITGPGFMPGGKGCVIGRTQVRFAGPSGMHVAWLTQGADGKPTYSASVVETPGRYNFMQASIYRLKLNGIAGRPGLEVYPTLEVVPGNPKTEAFLAHGAVPLEFTAQDFQEVAEGKYLVKVIYLPDPQFQELAASGTDQIISTRLEPGADPLLEAQRRGSILLVIRMGNVDQERQTLLPWKAASAMGPMMVPMGDSTAGVPSSEAGVPPYLRFGATPPLPGGPGVNPVTPPAPTSPVRPTNPMVPTSPVSHLPDPSTIRPTGSAETMLDERPAHTGSSMPALPSIPEPMPIPSDK